MDFHSDTASRNICSAEIEQTGFDLDCFLADCLFRKCKRNFLLALNVNQVALEQGKQEMLRGFICFQFSGDLCATTALEGRIPFLVSAT